MRFRLTAVLAAGALAWALSGAAGRTEAYRGTGPNAESVAGAAATPTPMIPKTPAPKVALGIWGGDHVRMDVAEKGAELEFDCAHGSTDQPVSLDDQGRFEIKGVFVREHHGPIRVGREPKPEPALYTGKLQGTTMTLWVTLMGSNETIGTYSLVHGEQARVRKCR